MDQVGLERGEIIDGLVEVLLHILEAGGAIHGRR
jgi:hypothetical protein